MLTGCGTDPATTHPTPTAPAPTTESGASSATPTTAATSATSPSLGQEEALRAAVQGYSDAFLTGKIAAYDGYFSKGCKAKVVRNYFLGILTAADDTYGSPMPVKTFAATIDGNAADVSFTFDLAAINQSHETWVVEGGKWRTTDCG